ncbi:VOC family protein [Mucilaginibacter sp. L3T2-6]|uniref:VOC family protein n=1 Tax=Mucilaginibacter sp. L3T2-6 TaxID=3062491 RepID=UPI0026758925|nr:VOC family protein [Mucilaginibacter sp. L3T2-6]MDO3643776.1 VOC family protein [Mucilaginibacter sp. L3T2-6]MDV6216227.1 VOC family protein [Mucilaginibacter sp. L3T2-6]
MKTKTTFAPELIIPNGITDISFYSKAFNAVELWRLNNDDGSVHVAGFTIDDALFHIHEQTAHNGGFSPDKYNGTTVAIGLMVDDVHAAVAQAEAAGGQITSPVTDYDYGYRQGSITDPFGHHWTIEKIIDPDILTSGNYGK